MIQIPHCIEYCIVSEQADDFKNQKQNLLSSCEHAFMSENE